MITSYVWHRMMAQDDGILQDALRKLKKDDKLRKGHLRKEANACKIIHHAPQALGLMAQPKRAWSKWAWAHTVPAPKQVPDPNRHQTGPGPKRALGPNEPWSQTGSGLKRTLGANGPGQTCFVWRCCRVGISPILFRVVQGRVQ